MTLGSFNVLGALNSGIVSYMKFENSLNNENGINNGQSGGTIVYQTGKSGLAVNITTTYINVTDTNNVFDMQNDRNITISIWNKAIETDTGGSAMMARTGNVYTQYEICLGRKTTEPAETYASTSNGASGSWDIVNSWSNCPALADYDTWYHYVIIKNGTGRGELWTYRDGVVIGKTTPLADWVDNTGNLVLGQAQNTPKKGLFDEFIVWDRALSNSEVVELYSLNGTVQLNGTNFTVSAYNNKTNELILEFNITINNTLTLNTTSGRIITGINSSKTINLSIIAQGYDQLNYTNLAVINETFSANLTPLTPNKPNLTIPIENQNVTQFLNITYTNATAIVGNISFYNISLLNNDYSFNRTIKSNNSLNNSYYWNTYNENLDINTYKIMVEATDTNGYKVNDTKMFNIISNGYINITAKNVTSGTSVTSFSIEANDLNTGIITNYNTTTGILYVNVIKGNTYSLRINATNYAYSYYNKTASVNYNNYTFNLYPENSINITFYDEINKKVFSQSNNYPNITLIIQKENSSVNSTVITGNYLVTKLDTGMYLLRYSSSGFLERTYYYTVTPYSTSLLSLYLINNTESSTVKINVKDLYGNIIEGAYIKLLRYYIDTNTYETVEISKTDYNGNAYLQIQLATTQNNGEFYKFIIELNDKTYLETTPSKIYDTTLNFVIATTESTLVEYNDNLKLFYDISFNNNTDNFRLTWSDGYGNFIGTCLKVYKVSLSSNNLYGSSCVNSSSGSILVPVDNITGSSYEAKAYAYYGNYELYLGSLTHNFNTNKAVMGKNGLFFAMIMIMLFALLGIYNLYISVILMVVGLIIMSMFGLITIGWATIMGIVCIALFIVLVKRNG